MPVEHITRLWADELAASGLSQRLRILLWVVPTSQSVHIAALSVVFTCALLIGLRLIGVSTGSRSVGTLVRAVTPWMYAAAVVCLLTGVLQTVIEPVRQFVTPAFWSKMLLLVIVVALTVGLDRSVRRHPRRWEAATGHAMRTRLFGVLYLGLCVAQHV